MKHVEVPDVGVPVHFPSISIHAMLKHRLVSVKFERKTEVMMLKSVTMLCAAFYASQFSDKNRNSHLLVTGKV